MNYHSLRNCGFTLNLGDGVTMWSIWAIEGGFEGSNRQSPNCEVLEHDGKLYLGSVYLSVIGIYTMS